MKRPSGYMEPSAAYLRHSVFLAGKELKQTGYRLKTNVLNLRMYYGAYLVYASWMSDGSKTAWTSVRGKSSLERSLKRF